MPRRQPAQADPFRTEPIRVIVWKNRKMKISTRTNEEEIKH